MVGTVLNSAIISEYLFMSSNIWCYLNLKIWVARPSPGHGTPGLFPCQAGPAARPAGQANLQPRAAARDGEEAASSRVGATGRGELLVGWRRQRALGRSGEEEPRRRRCGAEAS